MGSLRPQVQLFLDRVCPAASVAALPGDVSSRRFFRIQLDGGGSRVLMDYRTPFSGRTGDLILEEIFRGGGLPVAEIFEFSGEAGCLLLEDLGPDTLESVLEREGVDRRVELLHEAVRLAANIAVRGTPALARSERADGPALDSGRFRFEMDYFLEHYVAGYLGRPIPEELRGALYALADEVDDPAHRVLCHRDYHSRNLMVRSDDSLAMVDIQDARWGPDTYDLASILYDAYIEVETAWIPRLIETFLENFPTSTEPADFLARLHLVSTQRMIKALGTFGRQMTRNGPPHFLNAITRTRTRLRAATPQTPLHNLLTHHLLLPEF